MIFHIIYYIIQMFYKRHLRSFYLLKFNGNYKQYEQKIRI
jgi:hypothetical protein